MYKYQDSHQLYLGNKQKAKLYLRNTDDDDYYKHFLAVKPTLCPSVFPQADKGTLPLEKKDTNNATCYDTNRVFLFFLFSKSLKQYGIKPRHSQQLNVWFSSLFRKRKHQHTQINNTGYKEISVKICSKVCYFSVDR